MTLSSDVYRDQYKKLWKHSKETKYCLIQLLTMDDAGSLATVLTEYRSVNPTFCIKLRIYRITVLLSSHATELKRSSNIA
jgi:hypothetical protein